ncbi:hypothetical protein [Dactylosporangium sp. CA-233914]|uniref:hypothetical protein n=1 Tax=Dactylosporangium sp. CA-233914 TaxID=3239934 RepID=UPI003D906D66
MSRNLSGASLGVQAGQTFSMTRLQTTTASLSELGTDRTTTSHTTTLLSQHRIQPTTPLRLGDPDQHLTHDKNLENRGTTKTAEQRKQVTQRATARS